MDSSLPCSEDVLKAFARIQGIVHETQVITCQSINQLSGVELFCKCENLQKTGSFKFRGATNALKILEEFGMPTAVATHSSGNHGAALAHAANNLGILSHIVMPKDSSRVKQEAVDAYGGRIIHCVPTLDDRENTLKKVLEENEAEEIPPYNDARIIAGQGTAAIELCRKVSNLDFLVTPVGGGGLLSGSALALQTEWPDVCLIGAEPKNVDDAQRSLKAGRMVPATSTDTIADGLRTSLGDLTFAIIHKYVHKILTVSEEQILATMRLIWERMKLIVEPSGAVSLAVVLNYPEIFHGKRVGLIFSGGNVDLEAISSWFN